MEQAPYAPDAPFDTDTGPLGDCRVTPSNGAPTDPRSAVMDRTGFDIGWDHAHHGLVPPAELLLSGTPVSQGWLAGKAVFGRRTLRSTRHTRQWLQLRIDAWRLGIAFEGQQVTPNYLGQIEALRCPVTRQPLHGLPGQPDTGLIARLNPLAGCAAGNLAMISQSANSAWQGMGVEDCVRQAHAAAAQAARDPQAQAASTPAARPADTPLLPPAGLPAAAWWRLAALRSYATPLPFAQAAGLPMAALPPNRVRLLNAVQGLQALLTRAFAAPGWAERCRRFAQWLPEHTLRQDFNLFVGAMAPRVLEAGQDPSAVRQALEDAWLNERVLRRWTHFALSLGEAATEKLLQRATDAGLAGVRTLHHAAEQATEGWALPPQASTAAAGDTPPGGRPGPARPAGPALRVAARLRAPRAYQAPAAQALLC